MGFEALLLDAGGVLLLPSHEPLLAALGTLGLRVDAARFDGAHYAGIRRHDAAGVGETGWREYLEAYVSVLDIPDPARDDAIAVLFQAFGAPDLWTRAIPSSAAALRALVESGVRVGIVSNSDGTVERRLGELAICQVGRGPGAPVEVIVDSRVVGVEKPDPAIFAPALEALDLDPDECLYVGDSVRYDVRGALAAGITPVLLDPDGAHDAGGHPSIPTLGEVAELLR